MKNGKITKQIQIAKKLIEKGISLEEIAQITDLNVNELKKMSNKKTKK